MLTGLLDPQAGGELGQQSRTDQQPYGNGNSVSQNGGIHIGLRGRGDTGKLQLETDLGPGASPGDGRVDTVGKERDRPKVQGNPQTGAAACIRTGCPSEGSCMDSGSAPTRRRS